MSYIGRKGEWISNYILGKGVFVVLVFLSLISKVLNQIIYLNFFEILVPVDGSYFSHSHPEIWHSKIGYLR